MNDLGISRESKISFEKEAPALERIEKYRKRSTRYISQSESTNHDAMSNLLKRKKVDLPTTMVSEVQEDGNQRPKKKEDEQEEDLSKALDMLNNFRKDRKISQSLGEW